MHRFTLSDSVVDGCSSLVFAFLPRHTLFSHICRSLHAEWLRQDMTFFPRYLTPSSHAICVICSTDFHWRHAQTSLLHGAEAHLSLSKAIVLKLFMSSGKGTSAKNIQFVKQRNWTQTDISS